MNWRRWTVALITGLAVSYVFYDLGHRRCNIDQTVVHPSSGSVK